MAITLTSAFLAELRKSPNVPNVIVEVVLDSGTVKWGMHTGGFSDVLPIIKSVSSFQNKIDASKGYSTRGDVTLTITGRDNFKTLISGNYLKNRRVTVKQGFVASGFAYSDYAATFTGTIQDWTRKGDDLTLTIKDDLVDASTKIPTENTTGTQYIDYTNMHPVDIMTNILLTQLGISSGYVDSTQFTGERDQWLPGWKFNRVITEPKEADSYINELQQETNSFIFHDGEKVSFKVFAPPNPTTTVEGWSDTHNILENSLSQKSGYKDNFYNRMLVYYDYDESGSDNADNFDSAVIAADAASQGTSQWNEAGTKTIKSKWIRSYTFAQTTNIGGLKVYHVSKANGAGAGTLTYNKASNTLQWTPPGGTIGEAVTLSQDGKFDVYGSDKTKFVRVLITTASLPTLDKTDTLTISALSGSTFATTLATKILNRYRDPVSTVTLDVDINNVAWNSAFIKPTDLKDITSDEACEKGASTWAQERVMLTSVKPDFGKHKISIEAIETKMYVRYGFIAPAGTPDYGSASAAQKRYGFIGDATNNKVNGGTEAGYYIW